MMRYGRLIPVYRCGDCHYCIDAPNNSGVKICSATDAQQTVFADKEPPDNVCPFDLTHLTFDLRYSIECSLVTTFQELRLELLRTHEIPESNDVWNIAFFALKKEYGFIESREDLLKLHDKFEAVWNQEQERINRIKE